MWLSLAFAVFLLYACGTTDSDGADGGNDQTPRDHSFKEDSQMIDDNSNPEVDEPHSTMTSKVTFQLEAQANGAVVETRRGSLSNGVSIDIPQVNAADEPRQQYEVEAAPYLARENRIHWLLRIIKNLLLDTDEGVLRIMSKMSFELFKFGLAAVVVHPAIKHSSSWIYYAMVVAIILGISFIVAGDVQRVRNRVLSIAMTKLGMFAMSSVLIISLGSLLPQPHAWIAVSVALGTIYMAVASA